MHEQRATFEMAGDYAEPGADLVLAGRAYAHHDLGPRRAVLDRRAALDEPGPCRVRLLEARQGEFPRRPLQRSRDAVPVLGQERSRLVAPQRQGKPLTLWTSHPHTAHAPSGDL